MGADASSPLESLWSPSALARVLVAAEGLALVLALAPGTEHDRLRYFLLASLGIDWTILLTLGLLYLLRRELGLRRPTEVAGVAVALFVLSCWIVMAAAGLLNTEAKVLFGGAWGTAMLRVGGMAITVGILALLVFRNYWSARVAEVRAKHAQLQALTARIQPHFLFNTLNTAVALVRAYPEDAERVLTDLADLFRAALASPCSIPIGDELETTRRYLDIESLRLGSRLELVWRVADDLPRSALVPNLSIQPLAENAVRHGIEPNPANGRIEVEAIIDDGLVRVTISNPALHGEARPGHHIGLESARERIDELGNGSRLKTYVLQDRHVALIELPIPGYRTTR